MAFALAGPSFQFIPCFLLPVTAASGFTRLSHGLPVWFCLTHPQPDSVPVSNALPRFFRTLHLKIQTNHMYTALPALYLQTFSANFYSHHSYIPRPVRLERFLLKADRIHYIACAFHFRSCPFHKCGSTMHHIHFLQNLKNYQTNC